MADKGQILKILAALGLVGAGGAFGGARGAAQAGTGLLHGFGAGRQRRQDKEDLAAEQAREDELAANKQKNALQQILASFDVDPTAPITSPAQTIEQQPFSIPTLDAQGNVTGEQGQVAAPGVTETQEVFPPRQPNIPDLFSRIAGASGEQRAADRLTNERKLRVSEGGLELREQEASLAQQSADQASVRRTNERILSEAADTRGVEIFDANGQQKPISRVQLETALQKVKLIDEANQDDRNKVIAAQGFINERFDRSITNREDRLALSDQIRLTLSGPRQKLLDGKETADEGILQIDKAFGLLDELDDSFFGPGKELFGLVGRATITEELARFSDNPKVQAGRELFGVFETIQGEKRHELFAGNLTKSELARAELNLPSAGDSKTVVRTKLKNLRAIYGRALERINTRAAEIDGLLGTANDFSGEQQSELESIDAELEGIEAELLQLEGTP